MLTRRQSVAAIWPTSRARVFYLGISLVGALSLALISPYRIPLLPVPVTLQVLGVLLLAGALGPWLGAFAVLEYLMLGLSGAPVFAGWAHGPLTLFGPTGGYLLALPLSAAVAGVLYQRLPAPGGYLSRALRAWVAGLAGVAIIYLGGWAWLCHLLGPAPAFHAGVAPFILVDLLKAALVAAIFALRRNGVASCAD